MRRLHLAWQLLSFAAITWTACGNQAPTSPSTAGPPSAQDPLPPISSPMPCNHCSFETSFTFEQGWTSDQTQRWGPGGHVHDGFGSGTDGRIQDGIDDFGDWAAASGAVDQVTVEANYGGGAGGRGYRHVRGNGSNNNGSGMTIRFPRTTEIWLRFYSRFKSGFRWSNGVPPGYAKEIYFKNDTSSVLIVDWL